MHIIIQNWPYPWGDILSFGSLIAFILLTWKIVSLTRRSGNFQELQVQVQNLQVDLTRMQSSEVNYRYLRDQIKTIFLAVAWLEALSDQITMLLAETNRLEFPDVRHAVDELVSPSIPQIVEWLGENVTGDIIRDLTKINNRVSYAKSIVGKNGTVQSILDDLQESLGAVPDTLVKVTQTLSEILKELDKELKTLNSAIRKQRDMKR